MEISVSQAPDPDLVKKELRFAKLPKRQKLKIAKKRLQSALDADSFFRKEAREDMAFKAGKQWNDYERKILSEEQRPALTFNLIRPTVDLIVGINHNNMITAKAYPTEISDEFLADILNKLSDKIITLTDLETKIDEAFEDAVTCGRGFIGLDIEPDPKHLGWVKIIATTIPFYEVLIDPSVTASDYSDARYIFWQKWISFEDFAVRYPDKTNKIQYMIENDSLELQAVPDTTDIWEQIDLEDETSDYEQPLDISWYDKSNSRIRLVHMEYEEVYNRYYGFNPLTGKIEEFQEEHLKAIKKAIPDFQYTTIRDKRVRWLQFTGNEILYDGLSPLPIDDFSIVPCFIYHDKSSHKINHYGIVRGMKDPQREINKRWSQTLNLLMKQSQGGWFAELDAPADLEQWEASITDPGATTWLKTGAIAQQKFMPKEMPQFPQGPAQMEVMAQEIMVKISGVNPDLLGIQSQNREPGVVVRMRQQQGVVMLGKVFNAYKKFKEQIFSRLYPIILKYMPDDQIGTILGGEGERFIIRGGLVADKQNNILTPIRNIRNLSYDIKVDEAPNNMTKTMYELATFLDLMGRGFPVDPKVVIEKLDLSPSEKERWIKYLDAQSQQQQQAQDQQNQMQQQMFQQQVQIQQQAIAEKAQADAQKAQQQVQEDIMDQQIKEQQLALDERESIRNYALNLAKLNAEQQKAVLDLLAKGVSPNIAYASATK